MGVTLEFMPNQTWTKTFLIECQANGQALTIVFLKQQEGHLEFKEEERGVSTEHI